MEIYYVIIAILSFVIGVFMYVWPQNVKRIVMKWTIKEINPFYDWMNTNSYLVMLKIGGLIAILTSIGLLYLLFV